MVELLLAAHAWLGWVVLAALLAGGAYALIQAPRGVALRRAPFSAVVAVVDLQVVLGVVVYVLGAAWHAGLLLAVVHPAAMVLAAVVAHVGVARGVREGGERGHQLVGATFLAALGIVALGVPWQG